MLKRYFFLIEIVIITIFVMIIADLFLTHIRSRLEILPEVSYTPPQPPVIHKGEKSLNYYSIINKRDIFTSLSGGGEDPSMVLPKKEEAVLTSLHLDLVGTITGNMESPLAIIDNLNEKKQDLYKVGDNIEGASIFEIERNKVFLKNNDRIEVLVSFEEKEEKEAPEFPPSYPPSNHSASTGREKRDFGKAVKKTGVDKWKLSRKDVTDILGDVNNFMTQVAVNPYFESGKPAGFRISRIQSDSLLRNIGLRNGDIIKRVNGLSIETPEQAFEAYKQIQNEPVIRIDIQRQRQEKTLTYEIM
jgi:general secretion pathway protein C